MYNFFNSEAGWLFLKWYWFFSQTTSQQQLATRRIFFNPFLIFARFFLLIKNIRIQGKEEKGPLTTFPMEKNWFYTKEILRGRSGWLKRNVQQAEGEQFSFFLSFSLFYKLKAKMTATILSTFFFYHF